MMNAWIIDDDHAIQRLLAELFKRMGMATEAFYDATSVLMHVDTLTRAPDVISVDLMLPGMTGFSLIRALRARSLLARVPMIVASARCEVGDAVLAAKLGATFIAKPFHIQKYMATVDRLIEMSRPISVVR